MQREIALDPFLHTTTYSIWSFFLQTPSHLSNLPVPSLTFLLSSLKFISCFPPSLSSPFIFLSFLPFPFHWLFTLHFPSTQLAFPHHDLSPFSLFSYPSSPAIASPLSAPPFISSFLSISFVSLLVSPYIFLLYPLTSSSYSFSPPISPSKSALITGPTTRLICTLAICSWANTATNHETSKWLKRYCDVIYSRPRSDQLHYQSWYCSFRNETNLCCDQSG